MIKRQRVPLLQMLTVGLLPSALKVWYYRLRGARIGRGVHIGPLTVLIAKTIEIGEGTSVGFATVIRGKDVCIRRHVKIGSMTFLDVDQIFIDDDTKINEQVFAGGPTLPESALKIGKNCIIMQYTFLNTTKPLTIGDGSGIGGHCLLFTHGSWQSELDGYPVTFAPITLGKNVWLPWRVFIMPGVTVGDDVTIGANSLVTRNIPAGSLAAGSPARILCTAPDYPRQLTPEDRKLRLERMLDEFFRYVEYHGYRVERQVTPAGFDATITGHSRGRLVYISDGAGGCTEVSANTAVLSLNGFADPPAVSANTMWLDLKNKSRAGACDLGEELAFFLSRYGVRFYRLD